MSNRSLTVAALRSEPRASASGWSFALNLAVTVLVATVVGRTSAADALLVLGRSFDAFDHEGSHLGPSRLQGESQFAQHGEERGQRAEFGSILGLLPGKERLLTQRQPGLGVDLVEPWQAGCQHDRAVRKVLEKYRQVRKLHCPPVNAVALAAK